jgi:cholesterol transport system auxiliary component
MTMSLYRAALLSLVLLSGCGALGAVSDASAPLDAYTLTPYAPGQIPSLGRRHLVVEMPTSGGALATDRILIKPVPFQAQYLPDGRWSEPTPALLQSLLVASFQNAGGFRLVGRTGAGLMPDYTLMTEIQSFQAEPAGPAAEPLIVRIGVMMTIIRESDRQIIAARPFVASANVASDDTAAVVAGFDSALQTVLREAVQWTNGQTP